MKVDIRLDTARDALEFSNIVSAHTDANDIAAIYDDEGFRVNAKSLLGALCALEFSTLHFESTKDLYHVLDKFII